MNCILNEVCLTFSQNVKYMVFEKKGQQINDQIWAFKLGQLFEEFGWEISESIGAVKLTTATVL